MTLQELFDQKSKLDSRAKMPSFLGWVFLIPIALFLFALTALFSAIDLSAMIAMMVVTTLVLYYSYKWTLTFKHPKLRRLKAQIADGAFLGNDDIFLVNDNTPVIQGLVLVNNDIVLYKGRTPANFRVATLSKDLLSYEIIINNNRVTSHERGSQLLGTAVGALALGAFGAASTGAIIGGLSGRRRYERQINKIVLSLVIKDMKTPIVKLIFFERSETEPHWTGEEELELAKKWAGRLEIILSKT